MHDTEWYKAMGLTSQVTLNSKLIKEEWTLQRPGVYHYAEFNEFAICLKNVVIQHFLLQKLAGRLGVVEFTSTVDSRVFRRKFVPDPQQYPTMEEAEQARGKGSRRGRQYSSL